MSKAESNRLCVGVDLHKTQFTVCALDEGGEYLLGRGSIGEVGGLLYWPREYTLDGAIGGDTSV